MPHPFLALRSLGRQDVVPGKDSGNAVSIPLQPRDAGEVEVPLVAIRPEEENHRCGPEIPRQRSLLFASTIAALPVSLRREIPNGVNA